MNIDLRIFETLHQPEIIKPWTSVNGITEYMEVSIQRHEIKLILLDVIVLSMVYNSI